MKALINHLINNNLETIVSRSLRNCHCLGLHSLMLLESPGQTIRLFYAAKGNLMYRNHPQFIHEGLTIGFHPHHCNLTLHAVLGTFWNWTVRQPLAFDQGEYIKLRQYRYHSQIKEGKQGFELIDPEYPMVTQSFQPVEAGQCLELGPKILHTVACNPFDDTAWLVFEGREDPTYESYCFSNQDLEQNTNTDLYQRISEYEIKQILAKILPHLS
ncbi:hypothetical protein IC229_05725 [Spirosoma sp. BT702]|uniref:Uncharacterized protein n=1 Tax=Spirosoma profusum TaxID=2771354 RepID=A0A927AMM6_9BACT|nr:hypothetical protein [Spirosoma profusum]MBD2700124.1 hypothetical protein [Spirosoma profusum]